MQKKHSIGSFELLSKTAPIQAASLVLLGPFVDYSLNGSNLLEYRMTWGAAVSTSISPSTISFAYVLNLMAPNI